MEKIRNKYSEKLKDPRWQKLRLQVFERDEWYCQSCCDDSATLAVHHKFYIPNAEPWEYPLDALTTLCESCHKQEFENRTIAEQELLNSLKKVGFLYSDIQSLANGFSEMPMLHTVDVVASVYEWAIKTPEIQKELIDKFFKSLSKKKEG